MNLGLFVLLLALLAAPIAGFNLIRYSENTEVLSSQDVADDLEEPKDAPSEDVVPLDFVKVEKVLNPEKGEVETTETTESVKIEEFDPATYTPANISVR